MERSKKIQTIWEINQSKQTQNDTDDRTSWQGHQISNYNYTLCVQIVKWKVKDDGDMEYIEKLQIKFFS